MPCFSSPKKIKDLSELKPFTHYRLYDIWGEHYLVRKFRTGEDVASAKQKIREITGIYTLEKRSDEIETLPRDVYLVEFWSVLDYGRAIRKIWD
jgi:hypothetical protein